MKEGEEFIMLLPGLGGSVGSLLSHVMAGGGRALTYVLCQHTCQITEERL
jgi:hypothetical protein